MNIPPERSGPRVLDSPEAWQRLIMDAPLPMTLKLAALAVLHLWGRSPTVEDLCEAASLDRPHLLGALRSLQFAGLVVERPCSERFALPAEAWVAYAVKFDAEWRGKRAAGRRP